MAKSRCPRSFQIKKKAPLKRSTHCDLGVKKKEIIPRLERAGGVGLDGGFFFFFFHSGFVRILACLVGDCLCMHHRERAATTSICLPPVVLIRVVIIEI